MLARRRSSRAQPGEPLAPARLHPSVLFSSLGSLRRSWRRTFSARAPQDGAAPATTYDPAAAPAAGSPTAFAAAASLERASLRSAAALSWDPAGDGRLGAVSEADDGAGWEDEERAASSSLVRESELSRSEVDALALPDPAQPARQGSGFQRPPARGRGALARTASAGAMLARANVELGQPAAGACTSELGSDVLDRGIAPLLRHASLAAFPEVRLTL